jgi:exopolysaccharide biosynthesis predicted pyruvyltransferase EpsI
MHAQSLSTLTIETQNANSALKTEASNYWTLQIPFCKISVQAMLMKRRLAVRMALSHLAIAIFPKPEVGEM